MPTPANVRYWYRRLFAFLVIAVVSGGCAGLGGRTNARRYGGWISSEFGGGGYVQRVTVAPSNHHVLYAHTDVGGLYRSDNDGKRWRMLHGNMAPRPGTYCVRDVDVDPRDDRVVLAAVGNQWSDPIGVLLSTDGGQSWVQVLEATFFGNGPHRADGRVLARDPRNPDAIVAVGGGDGLWYSRDGGVTWSHSGLDGINPSDVRFDIATPNTVWVCAMPFTPFRQPPLRGGFYRGPPDGSAWQEIMPEGPDEIIQLPWSGELVGIFEHAELCISGDGGQTWANYSAGLPVDHAAAVENPRNAHRFKALAVGPDFLLTASALGQFYRRSPADTQWQEVSCGKMREVYEGRPWHARTIAGEWQHFGSALGSITIHPDRPDTWFFTDWYAIYRTTDAGRSWDLRIDGMEVTVIHCVVQDPADPRHVYVGMADNGACYSRDGGRTIHSCDINSNMKLFAVAPSDPDRVYAVGDRGGVAQWAARHVWRSDDRGVTWHRLWRTEGLTTGGDIQFNTVCVDSRDADTVWLAASGPVEEGKGGPYLSTDGGATWQWEGPGLPATNDFFRAAIWHVGPELAVSINGDLVAASFETRQVFFRRAGMAAWQASAFAPAGAPHHLEADPFQPARFYLAVKGQGVYRSDDAGEHWQRVLDIDAYRLAVDRVTPQRLACGTAVGIYLSRDGGDSWQPGDPGLPQRQRNNVGFAGHHLLAGTDGAGVFWLPLAVSP